MTNEELFDDLKQFISAQNSQLEDRLRADLATKSDVDSLRQELKQDIVGVEERLGKRLDDVQAAVGDAITHVTDALDVTEQVRGLDKRLRRLEHRTA